MRPPGLILGRSPRMIAILKYFEDLEILTPESPTGHQGKAHPLIGLVANRQLSAHLFPTADRSVFVEWNRQVIAPFAVGRDCFSRVMGLLPSSFRLE
jgi:hypothetical protein